MTTRSTFTFEENTDQNPDQTLLSLHITRAWSLDYVKLRNIGQQFPRSIEMDFAE